MRAVLKSDQFDPITQMVHRGGGINRYLCERVAATVIAAQAGIHRAASAGGEMDSRLRRNDEKE